jgi:hypothetical protein
MHAQPSYDQIQNDFLRKLAEIEAESMGWLPLEDGVVEIVGLADAGMAGVNVLWIVAVASAPKHNPASKQCPAPTDECFPGFIRLPLNTVVPLC